MKSEEVIDMKLYIEKDYEQMSKLAAKLIADKVHSKENCVLGLATGSTPIGTYKELIKQYQAGTLSFAKVKTVNLDEYYGLEPEHEQSYAYFMRDNLFNHIDLPQDAFRLPSGTAKNIEEECKDYEKHIEALGGVDLQLLGIGHNGHIGFNEPAASFALYTHQTYLDERTIEANTRFFASKDEVPTQAITMGIGTIMKAGEIILLASGKDKADIIQRLLEGDTVNPMLPASILKLHPHVHVIVDEAAASLLKSCCKSSTCHLH